MYCHIGRQHLTELISGSKIEGWLGHRTWAIQISHLLVGLPVIGHRTWAIPISHLLVGSILTWGSFGGASVAKLDILKHQGILAAGQADI